MAVTVSVGLLFPLFPNAYFCHLLNGNEAQSLQDLLRPNYVEVDVNYQGIMNIRKYFSGNII